MEGPAYLLTVVMGIAMIRFAEPIADALRRVNEATFRLLPPRAESAMVRLTRPFENWTPLIIGLGGVMVVFVGAVGVWFWIF